MPPPAFQRFDAASEYRIYADPDVPRGNLRVSIINHVDDALVFEQWRSSSGATFAQNVHGGGSVITDEALDTIERLVWVGHWSLLLNIPLPGPSGWRLDFVRVS